jgi:copper chaperone
METLTLTLQNIKCDGCVKTIKNAMAQHENIKEVNVVKETGSVTITGFNLVNSNIVSELTSLGYPEIKKGLFSKLFPSK